MHCGKSPLPPNHGSTHLVTFIYLLFSVGWDRFIDHGTPLRFYVLFNGVMSCLYSVWDIVDDLVFRKVNESDASQFAKLCPLIPSRVWGVIWYTISLSLSLSLPLSVCCIYITLCCMLILSNRTASSLPLKTQALYFRDLHAGRHPRRIGRV